MSQNSFHPQAHVSLRKYNTFGFDEAAECLVKLENEEQLAALKDLPAPLHILGGGSNVLLTGPLLGTVVLVSIKGIHIIREDESHVWIRCGAGEVWHDFVRYAIGNNFGGIENLALIPGTVGAAPIQNIGAYGVEIKECLEDLSVWRLDLQKSEVYTAAQCRFGYRDSIFKTELKGKVLITSVTFRLNKHSDLNTSYGAIRDELKHMSVAPSVQSVAEAVINIRRSKLPDPAEIGNAGSFFKNPVVSQSWYESLRENFPDVPAYEAGNGKKKIAAGWLIEQSGWKGFRQGDAGVHARQALVLVNYGAAKGDELLSLSDRIMRSVEDRFGISLEREVQIW
jgi:UDP-N-acetylmuramate dehydrogenase